MLFRETNGVYSEKVKKCINAFSGQKTGSFMLKQVLLVVTTVILRVNISKVKCLMGIQKCQGRSSSISILRMAA
jgi:hypothetical protein